MYPVLRLGPAVIPSGPLFWLLAAYLALELADREGERRGLPSSVISTAGVVALVTAAIGGRLAYVAENWQVYRLDMGQVLSPTIDTIDPFAALGFGLIAAFVYVQRRQVALTPLLDSLAPGLALAVALISIGRLLSGDAYGAPASGLPWAIDLNGAPRHPVQVYDALLALAACAYVWRVRRQAAPPGSQFLLSVALLAAARLVTEALRGDSTPLLFGLRQAQVVALALLAAALLTRQRLAIMRPRDSTGG